MPKFMKRKAAFVLLILCVLNIGYVTAISDEDVEISIRKNVGTGYSDKIQGDFTLSCSAPSEIITLELYINGELIDSFSENSFAFRFNTDDYTSGMTNFTVKAYDNDGNMYQNSLFREILEKSEANAQLILILTLTGVIVVISLIIAYSVNKKQAKNASKNIDIDEVKID